VLRYLDGEIGLSTARTLTMRATTQYAKRQMTWFRREPDVVWFEGVGDDEGVRGRVLDHVRKAVPDSREPRELERSLC
jgi:tRNA dimethylallyltransferase